MILKTYEHIKKNFLFGRYKIFNLIYNYCRYFSMKTSNIVIFYTPYINIVLFDSMPQAALVDTQ
jgi:hypothetical protein